MVLTVADWLHVAIPPVGDALIDSGGLRRARAAARGFPGSCLAILESHLGPGRERLPDVSVRLTEAGEAREVLDRQVFSSPPSLLRAWATSPQASEYLRALWLEMDLSRAREVSSPPDPVLAVRISGEVSRGTEAPEERARRLLEILPRLFESPLPDAEALPDAQVARIRRCLEALPPSAYLLYVFDLRARGSRAVRLELFGPAEAEVLPYLESLGEEEAARTIVEALPLVAGADRLHLSFEVDTDGTILPRLGLEYAMARLPGREAGGEPEWQTLFERLIERGLATREQAEACLGWTGWETATPSLERGLERGPERWPRGEDGAAVPGYCARALSHLKLVCRAEKGRSGDRLEAKVYRAVQWLPAKGSRNV